MVDYATWTRIVFDVAGSLGMASSQENSQRTVSTAASIWNDRRDEIEAASEQAARQLAQDEVSVPQERTNRSIRGP